MKLVEVHIKTDAFVSDMGPKVSKLAVGWKRWTQSKGVQGNTDILELGSSNGKLHLSLANSNLNNMNDEQEKLHHEMTYPLGSGFGELEWCDSVGSGGTSGLAVVPWQQGEPADPQQYMELQQHVALTSLPCSRSSSSFCLQRTLKNSEASFVYEFITILIKEASSVSSQ